MSSSKALGGKFFKGKEQVLKYLKAGVSKRALKMSVRDFDQERLKKIPNYVALKVAESRIDQYKELSILGLLFMVVVLLVQVCSISSRLDKRILTLVPGRIEQKIEVEPGKVSPDTLIEKVISYSDLLGSVDKENITYKHKRLKKVMEDSLGIQFWENSKETRELVKNEGLSEAVTVLPKDVDIREAGSVISAVAKTSVTPYINGIKGKPRKEFILMEGKIVVRPSDNFWELRLFRLERGPYSVLEKVKRSIGKEGL